MTATYHGGVEDYDGQIHANWVLILNVCIKVFSLSYNDGHKHDGGGGSSYMPQSLKIAKYSLNILIGSLY